MIHLDELVVVVNNGKLDDSQIESIELISKKVNVLVTDDFVQVCEIVAKHKYKIVIIMTYAESFPDTWKINEIRCNSPVVILAGAKDFNLFSLRSFIETFEEETDVTTDNPLFRKSLMYIEENLHENDLSLTKAASLAYMSRCHYSRMFQKYLGTGFKQYVMTKRIQRAKALLQKGRLVTEVCYSVGYNDLTHFSRVFRKKVGVNPSTYRLQKAESSRGRSS
ncbi:helix-turn-helix transcriptional regulator [Brevibacillus fulvus]|uniref:AraC-like DNA-binding protein n=1 Tax=Brevibacillus fulvus TaxID=1125967 RepID=A0A938XTB9_9BACL|nr:AraC family transcriptional regulator [Brevibacillus fulvus]MBM7589687.1 AraC-like DNA-binding protein [Brevibacillus fulvus]